MSALLMATATLAQPRPATRTTDAGHGADDVGRRPRADAWDAWGEARARATAVTRFVQDETGAYLDPGQWWSTRLVTGARYLPTKNIKLELEVEGLNGYAVGDTTSLGTSVTDRPFPVARDGRSDLGRVLPRNAHVAWATPAGVVTAGAQSLTWGTGMLVNDGAGDRAFGDAWQGNVAARVAFGTRPLQGSLLPRMLESAVVFAGGDYVLRDDNASVYDGDSAVAAVAGIRAHEGIDAFGVLLSIRHQVDREDRYRPGERAKTTAYVIDVHARTGLTLSEASRLVAEVEAASVRGHSTRPWSDATWRDGADVRQFGGIARLRVDLDRLHATTSLEGGYASGDNDPRDTVARTFTMSTDYNVGMVLFDHVLPLLTARGVDRAADASLVGQPSPSTRFAINPGAVQNAIYGNLVLRWRPVTPLDLRVGVLYAVPAADLMDAYQTAIQGGYPTSYGGRVQSRGAYGHELDTRATWRFDLPGGLALDVGPEGGVLFPGGAFDGVAGLRRLGAQTRAIWLGRARLSLMW